MTDVLTPAQRKLNMSRIRNKNTRPEIIVRSIVYRLGYRYRLNVSELPGKPDLVFRSRKKLIFVHGCFWHMHDCIYGNVKPKTNTEFWELKREGNVKRDARIIDTLVKDGWEVLVIWECWTRDTSFLENKIIEYLST